MKIEFASDNVIRGFAIGQVTNNQDYDLKGVDPNTKAAVPRAIPGGLYDEYIFGLPLKCKCGSTSMGKCPICKVTAWDEKSYLNNYAYYQMKHYIITDMKLHSLELKLKNLGIDLKLRSRTALADLYSKTFSVEELDGPLKENEHEILDPNGKKMKLVIGELPDYTQDVQINLNTIGTYGLIALAGCRIKGKSLNFLADHINSVLPIISPGLRKPKFPLIGGKVTKQYPPINYEYRAIIEMDQRYTMGGEDSLHLHPVDFATILFLINKLYNVHVENSSFYKGGKEGLVRSSLQSRVGSSIRWNATNDHKLKLNEVKIPRSGAYHALQSQIITRLLEDYKDDLSTTFDARRLYMNQDPRAIKAFEDIVNNCVVIIGRNPTLHRNNLLAFKPILWDEPAICMNPYVCKSYNLDFDGDQLSCYFITEDFEKMLLGKRMNAENLWVFDKDNSPTYMPKEVCLTGLYLASKMVRRGKPKEFPNLKAIEQAFKDKLIDFDDEIILMPDKQTSYGREMLSKILKTDIENIIGENSTLDMQKLIRLIAGLMNRPDRLDIMRDLDLFGVEMATLVGVDVPPLNDLYSRMSPEVDKILNDKSIPEDIKLSKITEMMPGLLKKELKRLPDNNVDTLMSGSRVSPSKLLNLYTPYIRMGSNGKVKVGDSALIEGLSEEEYLEAAHTQREILIVKQDAVPRAGFNSTQLVLPSLDLRYSVETGKNDSYVFVRQGQGTQDFTRGRVVLPKIKCLYPGYAAIKSSATSTTNIVYRDEISTLEAGQLNDGARIGTIYGKAVTEIMYQASLGLKYGALMNDFNREDIRAVADGEVEELTKNYMIIGGHKYLLSEWIIPTDEVTNRKRITKGQKIAINNCLVNTKFRYASFDTLLDMKIITEKDRMYEYSEFRVPKGMSYAPFPGRIHYENGKMYIDNKFIDNIDPKVTYFFPEGWQVTYADRITSQVIDIPKLLQFVSKEYAFWPFYLDLNRVTLSPNPQNDFGKSQTLELGEILYKTMLGISFSIQKGLVNNTDFMTRVFYGATKKGLRTAADSSTMPDMSTKININEDNPLVKILLRQY